VPAKAVFLTAGPSRTIVVGGTIIQLRRTTPRDIEPSGRLSGLPIQAFQRSTRGFTTFWTTARIPQLTEGLFELGEHRLLGG
jgi:hypothetical protein